MTDLLLTPNDGAALCGAAKRKGTARHGAARRGTARHGAARRGNTRRGKTRRGNTRHGARHAVRRPLLGISARPISSLGSAYLSPRSARPIDLLARLGRSPRSPLASVMQQHRRARSGCPLELALQSGTESPRHGPSLSSRGSFSSCSSATSSNSSNSVSSTSPRTAQASSSAAAGLLPTASSADTARSARRSALELEAARRVVELRRKGPAFSAISSTARACAASNNPAGSST